MGTRRYILGKVLQALLALAFVMVFNFFLFRVIPSDPLETLLEGTTAFNPPNIEQLTQDLGLDKPLPQQFLIYARDTLTLNFGDSFSLQGQDVKLVIYHHIWPTLLLVATSTIASAAIGLLIGIYGGWRRGSRFDVGSQAFTLFVHDVDDCGRKRQVLGDIRVQPSNGNHAPEATGASRNHADVGERSPMYLEPCQIHTHGNERSTW